MKKVLIADDELLFRSTLRNMIENEMEGYYVCAQAGDGQEAWNMIWEKHPDIIVTDVRMPGMDGVVLTEKLRENNVYIPVIVVSNYDDYHYVKDTLKNGAADYILKHELHRDNLKEQLDRATAQVGQDGNESEVREYVRKNNMILKKEFLNRLLSGQFRNEDTVRQHMKILDITLGVNRVMSCLMVLNKYAIMAEGQNYKQISQMDYAILNILEEILRDGGDGYVGDLGGGRYLLLYSFDHQFSQSQIHYRTNALLSRIRVCAKNYLNDTANFCLDCQLRKITEIPEAYEYTRKLMEQRFFYEDGCVIEQEARADEEERMMAGLSMEQEKRLILALEKNQGWKSELLQVFQQMESCRMSLFTAKMILNDLFGILNLLIKKYSVPYDEVYGGKKTVDEIWKRFVAVSDAREWFEGAYGRLVEIILHEENPDGKSYYVKELLRRIREEYAQELSLSQAAEELQISTGYLSRMFKEEMQVGFAEYLNDYRIKMCIRLMEEHRYTLAEIAEMCGFHQYPYFVNVFKKKMGVPPKAYVKKNV